MSSTLLEPPELTTPAVLSPTTSIADCDKGTDITQDAWLSKVIYKSYKNSLNYCLSQLGWTPESILEIGSGDGTMLAHLGRMFMRAKVMGVDFDANTVAKAQEHHCCRLQFMHLSEAESLPFDDNSFDLIVCHGFLGHSSSPRHWMNEMSRVSAEGVIVSTMSPVSYRWFQRVPGAQDTMFNGRTITHPGFHPLPSRLVKSWLVRTGLQVEASLKPMPFQMTLARKPQHTA